MSAYRYLLRRETGLLAAVEGERVVVVMLNPSTANEHVDDPTIRRLRGFALGLEWRGFEVVNLFAARATEPEELLAVTDPVGEENDRVLRERISAATLLIAAWGTQRGALGSLVSARVRHVMAALGGRGSDWWCWGVTDDGSPRHPLYLRRGAGLRRWTPGDLRTGTAGAA